MLIVFFLLPFDPSTWGILIQYFSECLCSELKSFETRSLTKSFRFQSLSLAQTVRLQHPLLRSTTTNAPLLRFYSQQQHILPLALASSDDSCMFFRSPLPVVSLLLELV